MKEPRILIVDLGSQYTLVIGRALRALGYQSITLSPAKAEHWLLENKPEAIILSGGSGSVLRDGCPAPPQKVFDLGVPVLGICLGMQWITKIFGGLVSSNTLLHREYGPTFIRTEDCPLFQGIEDHRTLVWASHGDSVQATPSGFRIIAQSEEYGAVAAIANKDDTVIGVQFHPEVDDTPEGKRMLRSFLDHARCTRNWNPIDVVEHIRSEVEAVADEEKAILGFSGGVDSTIAAAILDPVFDGKLLCVAIDSGFLRQGEIDDIKERADLLHLNLVIIEAADRFQEVVCGLTDAQQKRAAFSHVYKMILEEEGQRFGAKFIIQGSLATDFIESGKAGGSSLIKSHHNIGLDWQMQELHPLRELFKYEVREIGRAMGLPPSITERQPFPGPGLLIRVIGTPAAKETVEILRTCDQWVKEIFMEYGLYDQVSQLVVALDGAKTVGVKGDNRAYCYSIIVRSFMTNDFMTGQVMRLSNEVIDALIQKLTKHPMVTRVFLDYTPKPPATTEME